MRVEKLFCVAYSAVFLHTAALAQAIFTCTDEHGRKISADRPIAQCADRNQNVLSPTGAVRQVRGPSLTAFERDALEQKEKTEADLRARGLEEKQRSRALKLRYPNRATHDQERNLALARSAEVILAAQVKIFDLHAQRKLAISSAQLPASDKSQNSPTSKRTLEDIDANLALQNRLLFEQEAEKNRLNNRFDQELAKLIPLWSPPISVPVSSTHSGLPAGDK